MGQTFKRYLLGFWSFFAISVVREIRTMSFGAFLHCSGQAYDLRVQNLFALAGS
jgi:hypothetical protein